MPAHAQRMSSLLASDREFVFCRVERRAHTVERRGVGREAGGSGRQATVQAGAGRGEERTWNMPNMFVTLEVFKLSGWLNAYAFCREPKGGHTVRGEVRPERREGGG